ncbi:DNA-binding response regulator, NarL/FixJ family, contains REC and HTH domains [Pedobacter steynii]|uniref:DNA-binding response regulator, NarL/FixJ family, contains REC and HTH domains n=1 Tax=Pedobacter steynii TaxID=430522 RepID=A0A1G9KZF0_9SPHI|nr:response regulator transcription factor [Pedobacter steynii]NQX38688.1 response regulator transcription factor [Pedobacter steynii]SDL55240.1 DNA-binding response regulator, NarL/FixJ family, contains REC and HTH domains [Pedobacter steynii]
MSVLFVTDLKILITDDHLIIQQGLGFIIKDFLNKARISYANSVNTTLLSLKHESVDLLILDINIPGGNNFKMIEQIREIQPDIKILLFSAYEERTYALRYLKVGVNGYLEKSASETEIRKAVSRILTKGKYFSPEIQDQLFDTYDRHSPSKNKLEQLTNREIEVARYIIDGEGTSSIGEKLALQVSTISTHKKNIFEKLRISNVSELIDVFRLHTDE